MAPQSHTRGERPLPRAERGPPSSWASSAPPRALVADARPHGVTVDTSVLGRLEALDQLHRATTGFNRFASLALGSVLLLLGVVLNAVEAVSKIRERAVLRTLGLRYHTGRLQHCIRPS